MVNAIRCRQGLLLLCGSVTVFSLVAGSSVAYPGQDSGPRRSLVQRPPIRTSRMADRFTATHNGSRGSAATFPDEFRSIDGTYNNLSNPGWGATGSMLLRIAPASYGDGIGDVPARIDQQSARQISNNVCDQHHDAPSDHRATAMLWQWGQFLDHDIDETPVTSPGEAFDIAVPSDDEWFDPLGTGNVLIGLDRSGYIMADGVRQQLNNITAFIDASNVYGSDQIRVAELRMLDGTGRLKTGDDNLLPFNTAMLPNAPAPDPGMFLAGDVRANEQIGLTAMHTVFMREHNVWAQVIGLLFPDFDGDMRYEYARAIVAAELQHITYHEFLPILLGPDALVPYTGYQPDVQADISNSFATAAFRVGHTMLSSPMLRLDAAGNEIPAGHLALADAFFTPSHIIEEGIDPILRGLADRRAQDIDIQVIDDVRNFLFGPPGAGGFDLAALNIQRGRDHGLPSYNGIRETFAMDAMNDFAEISPDAFVQDCLISSYDDVADIDPWVGMLAEPHAPNAMVGETFRAVLVDQFTRLRDGDRFWYESYLTPSLVELVNEQTLSQIIRRNTDIGDELPDDPFTAPSLCSADLDGNGHVDLDDLLEVIMNWGSDGSSGGDATADALVDLDDLLAIISQWGMPC